jgi:hypothetical protein
MTEPVNCNSAFVLSYVVGTATVGMFYIIQNVTFYVGKRSDAVIVTITGETECILKGYICTSLLLLVSMAIFHGNCLHRWNISITIQLLWCQLYTSKNKSQFLSPPGTRIRTSSEKKNTILKRKKEKWRVFKRWPFCAMTQIRKRGEWDILK